MFLGGLAIYSMVDAGRDSDLLDRAYVPEVDVANEIERNALEAVFKHRGFNYHNDPTQMIEGTTLWPKVDGSLITAKQLVPSILSFQSLVTVWVSSKRPWPDTAKR